MGQDAECYQKTVDDRAIILNARGYYTQPFVADNWTDLRLGFFLSLTDAVNDDLPAPPTGLAETIPNPSLLPFFERYWLGVLNPSVPGVFLGFTNNGQTISDPQGDSTLVSSDAGIGTSNTNFWRPGNSKDNTWSAAIFNAHMKRSAPVDNLQQHFPQNAATVAAGYAVLLALQLLRNTPTSRNIWMKIKSSTKSADMLYSNTPTKELIQQAMANWPPSVQLGPVTLSAVPNAFYFYWPFRKSRLRVHSLGLLRAA
jgi:hypothetical protein